MLIIGNIKSIECTNLEKMPENPHFCINYASIINCAKMVDAIAKSYRPFSTFKICIIKSITFTYLSLEKAENPIFAVTDKKKTF